MLTSIEFYRDQYASNAEFWIRIIREDLDPYRNQLTDAAIIAAIGSCQDQDILDAGCGEGYLSRLLAESGARVTGVDLCVDLIEAARALADRGLPITHDVGTVESLPYRDNSFDLVVANHLL